MDQKLANPHTYQATKQEFHQPTNLRIHRLPTIDCFVLKADNKIAGNKSLKFPCLHREVSEKHAFLVTCFLNMILILCCVLYA